MISAIIFTALGFLLRCAIDVAADLWHSHRDGEDAQRERLRDACGPGCRVVRRPSA